MDCGLLHAHFHEDFQADTEHASGKWIAPNNFREVFAVERHRGLGIGQSQEQAHTDFVAWLAGLEINAGAGNAESSAHIVEMILLRIRRTDAHELGDFAAATAAAFFSSCFFWGSATCWGCLSHNALLGLHE